MVLGNHRVRESRLGLEAVVQVLVACDLLPLVIFQLESEVTQNPNEDRKGLIGGRVILQRDPRGGFVGLGLDHLCQAGNQREIFQSLAINDTTGKW